MTPRIPPGLYAITDGPRDDLLPACAAALEGGARVLQYRDKTRDAARRFREARELSGLCARHGAIFLVNDDIELALASGADGVHLGRGDADIATARTRLGDRAILGATCHASLDRAREAATAGADYLAFGAFHPSPSKPHASRARPGILREARHLGLPLVAIGGITPDKGAALVAAGADCLAVISAVFGAADITAAARRFAQLFDS
jgi:thiamine-phosphate pyrophosphorylase